MHDCLDGCVCWTSDSAAKLTNEASRVSIVVEIRLTRRLLEDGSLWRWSRCCYHLTPMLPIQQSSTGQLYARFMPYDVSAENYLPNNPSFELAFRHRLVEDCFGFLTLQFDEKDLTCDYHIGI